MKKSLIFCSLAMGSTMLFTGCFLPKSHSMGASLMPAPMQHRMDASATNQQWSVAASGFYSHEFSESDNLKDMNGGGGVANVTYRLGGSLSPLFVNAAVGGFAGTLKFDCSDEDCKESSGSTKYREWLETRQGKDSYTFWNIQERILLGADLNLGPYLILGAAAGAQFFQGASDYDDMREKLDDEKIMEDVDGKNGVKFTSSVWVGSHLGRRGEFGHISAELDMLYEGGPLNDANTYGVKLTYAHPSGFFGGLQKGNLSDVTLYFGKEFIF